MSNKKKKLVSIVTVTLNTVALGTASVTTAYALRDNNRRSGELYGLVQTADESGVGITDALANLQTHVATHMNASPLPQLGENAPVQLAKSYERAKSVESARVTAERVQVTNEGIATCEAQFGRANLITRSNCIAEYGAAHPVQPEKVIIADLYRYDFVSPMWTPDKAGWLVVVSVGLALALAVRIIAKIIATLIFKR